MGTIAVMALAAWLFLTEAEIVVDQSTIAKRNLIGIWRHAPLTDVAGIGFRRIGIKHVGIVYGRDRRCIFWITSNVWDRDGLEALAQRLGGSSVERASTYTEINSEFSRLEKEHGLSLDDDQRAEIMDLGIGDIFNCRVAGNVENADILGSLEFACKLAGAKVVLVMGHTACGAIKGAIDNAELGNLTGLLGKIKPAYRPDVMSVTRGCRF